jgi:predicted alpha/beta hydrolase family esterase
MAGTRQILFIQGGGAGAHDEWDDKLFDSLRREFGDGYEVRYPRMPDEDDPSYARWSAAIRREMTALDDGAVVAGHSVGGTILINVLAERPPEPELSAIVLIAAPFVGVGSRHSDCRQFECAVLEPPATPTVAYQSSSPALFQGRWLPMRRRRGW